MDRRRVLPLLAAVAAVWISCSPRERSISAVGTYANAPVIVISIDTLRADHLPAFGYKGVETPNIDALRRDAILYTQAWSHVPLTLPSHVTMLTGKLPADNGVRDNVGYRVPNDGTSLPELLHAHGYATGAAVSSYVLRGETGLRVLFDSYDDHIPFQPGRVLGEIQRSGADTVTAANGWIDTHDAHPFFFLLHLFEPHAPYEPREPFRTRYQNNPYDGEIATADAILGDFVAHLKSRGIYDRAIIVLMSDHGEGLGDHGEMEHGIFLYRESLHVPLLIKLPGGVAGNTSSQSPVGLIDLLPTLTTLTQTPVPSGLRGISIAGAGSIAADRRIFSESMYPRLHLGWSDLRSLVDQHYHLIDSPNPELYAVADSAEHTNMLTEQRRPYVSMRAELDGYDRKLAAPAHVDPEEAKKLAALGYLTSVAPDTGPLPDPKQHIAELTAYNAAEKLAAAHHYDSAIAAYRDLLQRNPSFSDARLQLAKAYEQTGKYDDAVVAYKKLLELNPALSTEVGLSLGAVLLNMGKYDDARAHAELALNGNPGGAHLLLGRIALARNDSSGSQREGHAAMLDPHYASAATLLVAESLAREKKPADELALLDQLKQELATRAGGPLRTLEFNRADALVHLNRIDEAEAAFREEMKLFPDEHDAYTHLAALFILQQKFDQAEGVLEQMAAADPSRVACLLAADTWAHFGQPTAAATWRTRAATAPR